MGWLAQFYSRKLSWFVESYLADLLKGLMVLAGLMIFEGFLFGMRVMGYSAEKLSNLENVHYWASYATIGVLSLDFVIKLVLSIFRNE
jgi:hypothetical protein